VAVLHFSYFPVKELVMMVSLKPSKVPFISN